MIVMERCNIRTRTVQQAQFVCPRCGDDRQGNVVERHRWMSAFNIPMIPVEALDKVVECSVCRHQCDLGVLEIPTTDALADYVNDATRHAIAVVVRAGSADLDAIDPAVRGEAIAAMTKAGHSYNDVSLDRDLANLTDFDAALRLGRLVDDLTMHGKEGLIYRLVGIAVADGPMTSAERRAIIGVGQALRLSAAHVNGALAAA